MNLRDLITRLQRLGQLCPDLMDKPVLVCDEDYAEFHNLGEADLLELTNEEAKSIGIPDTNIIIRYDG